MSRDDPLNHKEVIAKYCELQSMAHEHVGFDHSADCFCGTGGFWGVDEYDGTFKGGYRNDMVVFEFIKQAVMEKIERDGGASDEPR